MDYKVSNERISGIVLFSLIIFSLFGCAEKEKNDTTNTYYVEMINFKDTLKKYVSNNIFGKVSFFKNNRMELVSVNYITNEYPDMHYYKSIEEFDKGVRPGSKKIRIELKGNYTTDSTMYSIQRFKYDSKEWIKISDIGFIKATATRSTAKDLDIGGLGNQIITNMLSSTY